MAGTDRDDAEREVGQAPVSAAEARAAVEAQRAERREERRRRIEEAFPGPPPGRWVIRVSWAATAVQTVVSVLAVADPDRFLGLFFATTMSLFLVGSLVFAADIVLAAARSTTHAMGIGGLFFLSGSAPRQVAVSLNASLAVVVVVSVVIAVARLSSPELAFGTLSPIFQLALSGLWGVRHGHFAERGADGG